MRAFRLLALYFLLCLATLPAHATECSEPLSAATLHKRLAVARELILLKGFAGTLAQLETLEAQLLCASEPVPRGALARLFLLKALAAWGLERDQDAEAALAQAIGIFPDLEWDDAAGVALPSPPRAAAAFLRVRFRTLTAQAPGQYTLRKAGLEGRYFLDGEPYSLEGAPASAPAGRHLLQVEARPGIYVNTWVDLAAGEVAALRRPRAPSAWNHTLQLASATLFLPSAATSLSYVDAGLLLRLRATTGPWVLEGWGAWLPSRHMEAGSEALASRAEAQAAAYANASAIPVSGAGLLGGLHHVFLQRGAPSGLSGRSPSALETGVGLSVGALYVPYVSQEMVETGDALLHPTLGPEASLRVWLGRTRGAWRVDFTAEAGAAVLVSLDRAKDDGVRASTLASSEETSAIFWTPTTLLSLSVGRQF